MPSLRGQSIRPNAITEKSILSVLESEEELPDDDPKTRGGGLDPSMQEDLPQLQTYVNLRQSGAISDKGWQRFIKRNPKSAVFLSAIQTSPEVALAKQRKEIASKYFNPGREEESIYSGDEDGKMVTINPSVPKRSDTQGAILEALNRGDIEFAKSLGFEPGNGKGAERAFNQEEKLRGEYNNASKTFIEVRDAYGRIGQAAREPSAAGDIAVLTGYMKLIDPTTGVKEGEFATAANAAGVPARIRNTYNNLLTGKRLGEDGSPTREDFVKQARGLYLRHQASQRKNESRYTALAKKYDLDPNRVVSNLDLDESPNTPKPAPESQTTKVIGGKTYVKVNGEWFEQ